MISTASWVMAPNKTPNGFYADILEAAKGDGTEQKGYGSITPRSSSSDYELEDDVFMESPSTTKISDDHRSLSSEIVDMFSVGASMIFCQVCMLVMEAVILMFGGGLGVVQLGGLGLALSLLNVTGYAVTAGLCTACETLFAQAYGSPNKKMVGVYLQRGILIQILALLVIIAINIYSDSLLIVMGQDPAVACVARRFLVLTTPGIFGLGVYHVLAVYVQVQDYLWPVIITTLLGLASSVGAAYVSIQLFDLGIDGTAIAMNVGFITMSGTMLFYVVCSGMYKQTWNGLSLSMFESWGQVMSLGVAGVLLCGSEYAGVEILTILAGTMGRSHLGAQVIACHVYLIVVQVPLQFSMAASVRIGTSLGSNNSPLAGRVMNVALIMGVLTTSSVCLVTMLARYQILSLFTTDVDVINMGADLVFVVLFEIFIESDYVILKGVLRGSGRQLIASVFMVMGMYMFGLPMFLAQRFVFNASLIGMWLVLGAVNLTLGLIFSFILYCKTNWEEQATLAQRRISHTRRASSNRAGRLLEGFELDLETIVEDEDKTMLSYRTQARRETVKRWQQFQREYYDMYQHSSNLNLVVTAKPNRTPIAVLAKSRLLMSFVMSAMVVLLCVLRFGGTLTPENLFSLGDLTQYENASFVIGCERYTGCCN